MERLNHHVDTAMAPPVTNTEMTDRLPRITAPTLVASGRYDGIAPLANGESIARGIPGAELRVYEGGHLFTAQDPKAQPEIIDFLLGDG